MSIYKDYKDYVDKSNDDVNIVTDTTELNQSIRNILLTRVGSLPGKPTFGSELYKILFSPLDHITIKMAKNIIRESLDKWEPRILINNVDVVDSPEFNKIVINVDYSYRDKDIEINDKISISYIQ